jgi:hypothetical protein
MEHAMKTLESIIAQLGINEAHAVKLLNQRARYALQRDRTKVYASTPHGGIYALQSHDRSMSVHDINADLITLKLTSDIVCPYPERTRDYVAAWCRLNHLKA